ncbi:MAG: acetate kinase [Candidatus Puniceispirillum sp.]|nr:acetate kinase [Candidatus Puniceispirillum sp.]
MTHTPSYLLCLNVGSTSVKFALFEQNLEQTLVLSGSVKAIGTAPRLTTSQGVSELLAQEATHEDAVDAIFEHTPSRSHITGVIHRIVHGGTLFTKSCILTTSVLSALTQFESLAPLHQPHNLAGVRIAQTLLPHAIQMGAFDTAFHTTLPLFATTLALPSRVREKGVRRYGFHGLSYAWTARILKKEHPESYRGRVVAAHLGGGASVCAMKGGISMDTSMGMTALEGPPMGTRSGSIDPGVVLFMLEALEMGLDEVTDCLYEESGLKGLSGLSGEAKDLLASPDPNARFALEVFAYRVAQYMASMCVAMDGVDAFVFTGGIGEKAAPIRDMILERLSFLGKKPIHIIVANEEAYMAREAHLLLSSREKKHIPRQH